MAVTRPSNAKQKCRGLLGQPKNTGVNNKLDINWNYSVNATAGRDVNKSLKRVLNYPSSRNFVLKTLGRQPGKGFLTVIGMQSLLEFLPAGVIRMDLLVSRIYPFIDSESLVEYRARDTLFRMLDGGFLLHLSSLMGSGAVDRLILIDCRAALVWINEGPDEFGREWE